MLAHAVREEMRRAGLIDLLEWKKEVDHNLQVIGVILSDIQSTSALALADSGTAKDRLDELALNLQHAMANVGRLVGPAQQDEDEPTGPTVAQIDGLRAFLRGVRARHRVTPDAPDAVPAAHYPGGNPYADDANDWPAEEDRLLNEVVDDEEASDPVSNPRGRGRRPRTRGR
jgi:hypothetical protein